MQSRDTPSRPSPNRRRFLPLAFCALAAALSAAGCATSPSRDPFAPAPRDNRSGVMVGSSGWLNGSLESPEGPNCVGAHAVSGNAALRPYDPWLGTIGLRQCRPGEYEFGFGLCLPGASSRSAEGSATPDRSGDVGVGGWLSFDF